MLSLHLVVPSGATGSIVGSQRTFERSRPPPGTPQASVDAAFIGLVRRYRASGGLARKHEVTDTLQRRQGSPVGFLDQCIARRQVFAFDWQSITWLPRFQFPFTGPSPLPSMTLVMEAMDPALDGWGCAHWFASPHPALDGRAPADVIAQDFRAVIRAAGSHRDPGVVEAL